MLIITGAAGFIGANIVSLLNQRGRSDLILADDFGHIASGKPSSVWSSVRYMPKLQFRECIDRESLGDWLRLHGGDVSGIIHMGACSDTTVTDRAFVMRVNLEYTQMLWRWCAEHRKPLIYASSGATYGNGELGYDDELDIAKLKPLNLYGESKQLLDLWALGQTAAPPRWAGLKFFNVYGPMEEHKGRMASVVFHSHRQILETGVVRLFKSHRPGIADGEQKRDFVYVKDVARVSVDLLDMPPTANAPNGIYNVGTGLARSYADLAKATFAAMGREPRIEYIPMPQDLQGKYQYFTQARVEKLTRAGLHEGFHSLEDGVRDYVTHHLSR